jgi:hypothetical protein
MSVAALSDGGMPPQFPTMPVSSEPRGQGSQHDSGPSPDAAFGVSLRTILQMKNNSERGKKGSLASMFQPKSAQGGPGEGEAGASAFSGKKCKREPEQPREPVADQRQVQQREIQLQVLANELAQSVHAGGGAVGEFSALHCSPT